MLDFTYLVGYPTIGKIGLIISHIDCDASKPQSYVYQPSLLAENPQVAGLEIFPKANQEIELGSTALQDLLWMPQVKDTL